MLLRPALFLATILVCAHFNEGRIIIKLSSLLGSKQSSNSLTDRLRNWLEARRQAGATQNADDIKDDGKPDDSDDANVEDDVDDDDVDEPETRQKKWLIYWKLNHGSGCKSNLLSSILNKFKAYANKYKKPVEPEQPVAEPEAPIGGGGKDQIAPDEPTTIVPTFAVSVP